MLLADLKPITRDNPADSEFLLRDGVKKISQVSSKL